MKYYGEGGPKDVDGGRALIEQASVKGDPQCIRHAQKALDVLDIENATIMDFLGSSPVLEQG